MQKDVLVVTDFLEKNSGKDVSDALQELILKNPNRTLYFPDGEYLLSKPILTPANPVNSVSLKLDNYAVIRAADDFDSDEALIRLGAAEPFNNITTPGSLYGIEGGIIDGSGRAKGISIDSGRETFVRNLSIKNTSVGIHVKPGANSNSSDSDIFGVNVVGNAAADSVGVWLEGFDNTVTNMRIAGVHTGMLVNSCGNVFRNLHPLYSYRGALAEQEQYLTGVAFADTGNDNHYDNCYSDQFATGFTMRTCHNVYDKSFLYWYTERGGVETAFAVDGRFEAVIRMPRVSFRENTKNTLLSVTEAGGGGVVDMPVLNNAALAKDRTYEQYLTGRVITF